MAFGDGFSRSYGTTLQFLTAQDDLALRERARVDQNRQFGQALGLRKDELAFRRDKLGVEDANADADRGVRRQQADAYMRQADAIYKNAESTAREVDLKVDQATYDRAREHARAAYRNLQLVRSRIAQRLGLQPDDPRVVQAAARDPEYLDALNAGFSDPYAQGVFGHNAGGEATPRSPVRFRPVGGSGRLTPVVEGEGGRRPVAFNGAEGSPAISPLALEQTLAGRFGLQDALLATQVSAGAPRELDPRQAVALDMTRLNQLVRNAQAGTAPPSAIARQPAEGLLSVDAERQTRSPGLRAPEDARVTRAFGTIALAGAAGASPATAQPVERGLRVLEGRGPSDAAAAESLTRTQAQAQGEQQRKTAREQARLEARATDRQRRHELIDTASKRLVTVSGDALQVLGLGLDDPTRGLFTDPAFESLMSSRNLSRDEALKEVQARATRTTRNTFNQHGAKLAEALGFGSTNWKEWTDQEMAQAATIVLEAKRDEAADGLDAVLQWFRGGRDRFGAVSADALEQVLRAHQRSERQAQQGVDAASGPEPSLLDRFKNFVGQ